MSDALKNLILQSINDSLRNGDSKDLIIECEEVMTTTRRVLVRREGPRKSWLRDLLLSALGSLLASAVFWLMSR